MNPARNFIAFDLGAESGRCVVGTFENERLTLHEVHRFQSHKVTVRGEWFWDILAIFEEMKTGLSRAVAACGPHFDGIGVDTWALDYVLIDEEGRLLGYPYHYRSGRTTGLVEAACEIVPREHIYGRTGIQFMQINTLYQLLAEQRRRTSLLEVADRMLMIPTYLLYLLSGEAKMDFTIASTTQLADPHLREWSWDLIDAFGLPRHVFPEIVDSEERIGSLLPELFEAAGMSTTPPVFTGASHDTAAAIAAVPATTGERWAYVSSGSWSLMGVEIDEPLVTESALAGNFTNEGGVEGTTRFLKNISGLWLLQTCRSRWEEQGDVYEYGDLVRLAAEEGPALAWVDPDDARFLAPGDMPSRIIGYLRETGQPARTDVGWITRCILESLAFRYRQVFRELEAVTGTQLDRLHIVGGGVRNRLLCQMTADALQREVVAGPVEGTVVGNLGMQATAAGVLDGVAELRALVARSFELTTYYPLDTDYWDDNEAAFSQFGHRGAWN